MNNKEVLKRNIQLMRDKLNRVVEKKQNLSSVEVLEISSLLDKALNKWIESEQKTKDQES